MIEVYGFSPGGATHPDLIEDEISDEEYTRRLQAYKDVTGLEIGELYCLRPELLSKLR